jgi:hypothetical protein
LTSGVGCPSVLVDLSVFLNVSASMVESESVSNTTLREMFLLFLSWSAAALMAEED